MQESQKLISKIIRTMEGMNKSREEFMESIFGEILQLRGRHNFLNLARYGAYSEKSYRLHYEADFDFLGFNYSLVPERNRSEQVLAFDPSFISKSGKHTPHLDKFWNSCTKQSERGLEIGGLALVDLAQNTALHLEAIQTPDQASLATKGWSRVNHYADCIISRKEELAQLSDYLCVDGYFGKENFIKPILEQTQLHLVCKFRKDADLRYLNKSKASQGVGRPRVYSGKINLQKIDRRKLSKCYEDQSIALYQGIVNAPNLGLEVKLCYVEQLAQGKATGKYRVLFSTDLQLSGQKIYQYYKSRFQIEFLFRDAKQFCGLTQCEARSESKMHFHYNAALTSVSIAKVAHHWRQPIEQRRAFSMADIKTTYFNNYILEVIFSNLGLDPELPKIRCLLQRIQNLGKIAA